MPIVINLNQFDILVGGQDIEYGYDDKGIVYSKYGANPPTKDPYPVGTELINKPVTSTSFDENVEVETGNYVLSLVARGGSRD